MSRKERMLSPEEEDFLREMMSIGSGWAATALTQLLQTNVEAVIPTVKVGQPFQCLPSPIHDPDVSVTAVRMHMLGDCTGDMFFILRDRDVDLLVRQMLLVNADWLVLHGKSSGAALESAGQTWGRSEMATSIISEMGNILAGVYLRAIYDFCNLSIEHTTPMSANDMIQSLLDESLALANRESASSILVESEFGIEVSSELVLGGGGDIIVYLLLIPSAESTKVLVESIVEARALCFGTGNDSGK